jgi:hypothetical protein
MKDFVVFYAWQSDRLERLNRHLIRFALNLAAKNISDDPAVGVRVRIDADTEGVLGHVPVTDTILKKIADRDAFVPHLTFISVTNSGKLAPKPNVMLEYGYALRARSHPVMIPVMNIAYGPADKLPFDMGHFRHPLQYQLPATAKNAERRAVRKALTEEFETILRLMIADARTRLSKATPFPEASPTFSPAFFFPPGAAIAGFGHPGEQEYRFEAIGRSIYGFFLNSTTVKRGQAERAQERSCTIIVYSTRWPPRSPASPRQMTRFQAANAAVLVELHAVQTPQSGLSFLQRRGQKAARHPLRIS